MHEHIHSNMGLVQVWHFYINCDHLC